MPEDTRKTCGVTRTRRKSPRPPLTDTEKEEILGCHAQGMTVSGTSRHTGISASMIWNFADKFGIRFVKGVGGGPNWTEAEDEELKAHVRAGRPLSELARQWQSRRTLNGISRRARRFFPRPAAEGVSREDVLKRYLSGGSVRSIAAEFGVTPNTVIARLGRNFRSFRDLDTTELEIIEERYSQGCIFSCIGKRIGRTAKTVSKAIKLHGFLGAAEDDVDLILDLFRAGIPVFEIAQKLEYPPGRVREVVRDYGGDHAQQI